MTPDFTLHLTVRRTALAVVGLLTCLAVVGPSRNVAAQMTSDVSDKAKRHYERGVDLYEQENYRRAATELRKAYSLAPSPLLLYNVAMAEWRSGDLESALATAYRVLEDGLEGEMQPTLQGRVRGFERIVRARRRVERIAATRDLPSPELSAYEGRSLGATGWLAIATGSAGALALFGALSIDRQIASDAGAFEEAAARGDAAGYRRRLDDLQRRQLIGRLMLGGGATLMATATGFLIAELSGGSTGTPRAPRTHRNMPVRISVTPTGHGLMGTISLPFLD